MSVTDRFSLSGKKALVTGASKGIGTELCSVLAEAGADIVALARDQAGLAEVQKAVEARGRRCLVIPADLGQPEAPERAAREALAAWGTIDILVNNAGVSFPKLMVDQTIAEWDLIQAVNLRAPWLIARTLVPAMMAQKSGKIVNVSSQTSAVALTEHGAYAASKNGLNGLTKVMTAEWAPYNIQCNTVCPTVTMTPMGQQVWGDPAKLGPMVAKIPAGRVAQTVEVCDVILFLCSQASDMINGQDIFVDGGYTAV
ncbi:SDR family oxidoreductase [Acidisoma cellulosilytica]|uniref:SDR family oxidoreductase n=1 Tax=Acidisoma cellulosilyticum TaxID=2802395 RepID=A0A964E602_9PROT|nr:SDR family oxidoreductase [Acidisoma cellulosilyticum]MCB8882498.1 SDR family oxidoreductase [Acidisoma cellulosilyticum]